MENTRRNRFKDLPWFEVINLVNTFAPRLGVVGVGGIGSWVALALSRAGVEFFVIDPDTVEEHNLGGQAFMTHHIGMKKVDAVAETSELMSGNRPLTLNGRVQDGPVGNVVICCPDNMEARKAAFELWIKRAISHPSPYSIFIDGRMTAENGQIYAVTADPQIIEAYRCTLFDSSEIEKLNCTSKATSHNGMIMGGLMAGVLFNHLTNVKLNMPLRETPLMTEYFLPTFDFRQYDAKSVIERYRSEHAGQVVDTSGSELVSEDPDTSDGVLELLDTPEDAAVLHSVQSAETSELSAATQNE